MSVTCREVHQTTLCDDIYLVAVLECISDDVLACRLDLLCDLAKTCHIHLTVEVSCVAADSSILHLHEMILGDDAIAACNCHEDVSERSRLVHLHDLEAVHNRLHCLDRVNLGNDDLGTETLGAHCHALSAPAVTCYHHVLTCNDEVCSTVDTVPNRLTCTVAIIEEVLAICIVDKHHRELQSLRIVQLHESEDACCGLLAASDDIRDKVCIFSVHQVHKVSAIVNDDVRSYLQHAADMCLIFLRSCIIPCKHIQTCLNEGCSYVVLGRKRIASCNIHLSATCCEHFAQISGLSLEVNRECYLKSLERKCCLELFLESVEKRHVVPYPIDLEPAVRPELDVSDFACHIVVFSCCFS